MLELVANDVAPKSTFAQQRGLVNSVCLAVQILVVSNLEKDDDIRPYLDLLKVSAHPRNPEALPHPLVMDGALLNAPSEEFNIPTSVGMGAPASSNDFNIGNLSPGLGEGGGAMLAWLDGTDLHRALFLRKRLYNRLSSGLFNGNEMHKTNFDYAVGLVLSRALSGNLPVAGSNSEGDVREVPLTLAPVLDFCNHSSAFNNAQHAAAADGALVLSATVDVKAGEEILIDYGQGR